MEDDQVNTPYDWIILGLVSAAIVPFIIANLVLFIYRKRRYFQAQGGVYVVFGSSISGLVWIFSYLVFNRHFTRNGLFGTCVLWDFWGVKLGIGCWFLFTILRLDRIFMLSRGEYKRRCRYVLFACLCLLPPMILSILASKFGAYKNRYDCSMKKGWKAVWIILSIPYLVTVAALLAIVRKQNDPLIAKEYTHTREYVGMAGGIYLLGGISLITEGGDSISGRCFFTFCICCLVFFPFWVAFGWPVYLCLFKPKEAMDKFEEELSESGARALQAMNTGYSLHMPSSESAILEAFFKAIEEVEMYKDKIRKLESQKKILQDAVRDLEIRRATIERLKSRRE